MKVPVLASGSLLSASLLVSGLFVGGVAHADTINGSVWEHQAAYVPGVALAAPVGAPSSTFTTKYFSYLVFGDQPGYTIGSFLGVGEYLGPDSKLALPSVGSHDLNNTIFDFTGLAYMTKGATYNVTRDGGMYLFINSDYTHIGDHVGEVIDGGVATGLPLVPDSFTWLGPSGVATFDLLYTEQPGTPALLSSEFPVSVTPEPDAFILMGTGLLSIAGVIRRRRRADGGDSMG